MSCSSGHSHMHPNMQADNQPVHEINPIVVNGETITEQMIADEVQHHPADSVEEAIVEASKALLIQKLLRQKAITTGLLKADATPEEEEQAISQLLDNEAYAPEATEDECKRYFEINQKRFMSSPLVEVSHILLAAAPDDIKGRMELKITAESLMESLNGNEQDFGNLAKKFSACPSKETGGSLGQISKGQTVSEFEKVVFNLPTGIAKHPVETRYGLHIVNVHHVVPGEQLEYDAVKSQVSRYLNEKALRKSISQYIEVALSEADVEGFDMEIEGSPLLQ